MKKSVRPSSTKTSDRSLDDKIGDMPAGRQPKDFPLKIRIVREVDGRWLAIIDDIPGVMAYGATKAKASAAVQALALRVAADLIEHGEKVPFPVQRLFSAA